MPGDIDSRLREARSLLDQGKLENAHDACSRISHENPRNADALHLLGVIELKRGRESRAVRDLRQAARLAPERADIAEDLGRSLYESSRVDEAIEWFQRANSRDPLFAKALTGRGIKLLRRGKLADAETSFRKAVEIDPGLDAAQSLLASILIDRHRYDAAVEILESALKKSPKNIENMNFLATAYEQLSRHEEAEALTSRILDIAPDNAEAALRKSKLEKVRGDLASARTRLTGLIETDAFADRPWLPLREIAQIYDRLGDYGQAFRCFTEANEAVLANYPSDDREVDEYRAFIKDCRDWFTASRVANWPPPPSDDIRAPVFFVGFPRSGTTLMEEVFAAHPDVITSQERLRFDKVVEFLAKRRGGDIRAPWDFDILSDEDVRAARGEYMLQARTLLGDDLSERQLVDKLPLNIRSIPIINRIFPGSKVIVAIRDPRDVCLSCFTQHFTVNLAMRNFLDIRTTARLYDEVMGLWLGARDVTTMRWLEYRYEDLLSDFPGTVGRVLDFLGLPWNDSVTQYAESARKRNIRTPSFHAVRQPLYKSAIGRWKNYREHLAPILPVLEPFVKEFGYEPS